jgi:hypothetical protein
LRKPPVGGLGVNAAPNPDGVDDRWSSVVDQHLMDGLVCDGSAWIMSISSLPLIALSSSFGVAFEPSAEPNVFGRNAFRCGYEPDMGIVGACWRADCAASLPSHLFHRSQGPTTAQSAFPRRGDLSEARRNGHVEIGKIGRRRAEERVLVNRGRRFPRVGVAGWLGGHRLHR